MASRVVSFKANWVNSWWLRTFVRYRRLIPGDVGSGETAVELAAREDLFIISSNWITNQSPFVPRPAA